MRQFCSKKLLEKKLYMYLFMYLYLFVHLKLTSYKLRSLLSPENPKLQIHACSTIQVLLNRLTPNFLLM